MTAEELLAHDFGALPDLIRAYRRERPDHPALIEGDETLTYGALAALMDRIAFALQRNGLANGDVVAICARTSVPYAAAFLGALAAGAAVALLAPSSSPSSLMRMLKDSGAKAFYVDRDAAEALERTGEDAAVRRVALDDSEAGAPSPDGSARPGLSPPMSSSPPSSRSTSSIPRARPARPKASCSPTGCDGGSSPGFPMTAP